MRKSLKKLFSTALAATLALAATFTIAPATADAYDVMKGAKRKVDKTTNLDTPEYHAYLCFQCVPAYSFRNSWFASYGDLDKQNRAEDGGSLYQNVLGWAKDGVNELAILPGTFTDAVIDGNGTYTVKVEGLEGCLNDGVLTEANESFQMLYISTDLPVDAQDKLQITNIETKIDGVSKNTMEEAYYDPDPIEYVGCHNLDIVNLYNNEFTSADLMLPQDSIEITFTVSGFNVDSQQTAEEATSSSSEASSSTDTTTSNGNTNTTTTSQDSPTSNSNMPIIIFVVIGVVVVVIVVVVILVSRKKE
ncbi:MAG: hypothetical protein K6G11_04345 [Lachnospiraceae bacterium]|nr:hypothetical protein [Lachnospiraceae bacterium]